MSPGAIAEPEGVVAESEDAEDGERRLSRNLKRLLKSPAFVVGAAIVLIWTICALLGGFLAPQDPYAEDLLNSFAPPSVDHWFGSDRLGRDIFSRVIVGSRDILTIAPLATIISSALGSALGLTMGYFGGWVDEILSRLVDAVLSLPTILVALLALTALGPSSLTVLFVISFTFAPIVARTVRASVLSERGLEYVAAAELRRETRLYILFVEILPNVLGPILVEATVRLGYAIFAIATLSFIGSGIQPPSADWGLSIASNYGYIASGYWWLVLFDAMAIASLVVGVNLIADSVQSLFDE